MPTDSDLRALLPAREAHPFDPVAQSVIDAAIRLIDSSVRLYTIRQASKLTGLNEKVLRADISSGKLKITHSFSERRNLIDHEELRRYVEGHRQRPV